jgi:hypothetical protein
VPSNKASRASEFCDGEGSFQQKKVMKIGGIKTNSMIISKGKKTGQGNLLQIKS